MAKNLRTAEKARAEINCQFAKCSIMLKTIGPIVRSIIPDIHQTRTIVRKIGLLNTKIKISKIENDDPDEVLDGV